MGSQLSYLVVIAVWATTPLAIKLSSQGYTPLAAVGMRFVLASLFACIIIALVSGGSSLKGRHWKAYAIGSLGIFPNMPLVYWATQYISSGLVSVMFATSPLMIGVFSAVLLKQNNFSLSRVAGFAISMLGLLVVCFDQLGWGSQSLFGIALMFLSTVLFALSSVLLKKLDTSSVDPLEQSFGSMIFALPGLCACWLLFDGVVPQMAFGTSLWAVIYLAVVGSIIGFIAFYYALKRLPLEIIGTVPLLSPVLAISLGVWVAGEKMTLSLLIGALLMLLGLAIYELLPLLVRKVKRNSSVFGGGEPGV